MSAALDTMAIIWGLRSPHHQGQRTTPQDVALMQKRALLLLRELDEQKESIVIPTVTAAELLCGVAPQDHANFLAELQRRFLIWPLDLRASAFAAQIWQFHHDLPEKERYDKRPLLKADALIIGTAKAAGVKTFYSHERRCRNLAEKIGLQAKDLPTKSENMLLNLEILGET